MSENKLAYKKCPQKNLLCYPNKKTSKLLRHLSKNSIWRICDIKLSDKKSWTYSWFDTRYFIKSCQKYSKFKNPKCFKGWLNNIITNTYYDFVRKHKRTPETISIDYTCEPLDIQFKIELPDKKVKPIEKCISSECEKFIKEAIKICLSHLELRLYSENFKDLAMKKSPKQLTQVLELLNQEFLEQE